MLQFWRVLYWLFFPLFQLTVRVLALFSPKVRLTLKGRQQLFEQLECAIASMPESNVLRVWIHAASVGEFEQARPLIQRLRNELGARVFVSFLSVSGYEARKNYPDADLVCYLPEDTERNAARFIELLRPSLLLVMRYDFWFNHLFTAREHGVELILVNAVLSERSTYLRPVVRSFYKQIFLLFNKIFTVTPADTQRFKAAFGIQSVEAIGDTRYDQVWQRSQSRKSIARFEPFFHSRKVLVAGSIWPADVALLIPAFARLKQSLRCSTPNLSLILVPHEVDAATVAHLQALLQRYGFSSEKASALPADFSAEKVLIVDEIGYLAELYALASVAFVGGGFGKNVHSVLEAAAHGVPVVYGYRIKKSPEAQELAASGGGTVVHNGTELYNALYKYFTDDAARQAAGNCCAAHVRSRLGATEKILQHLLPRQNSLSTNAPVSKP
ncbi:MAG: glycosyltransferase N-terminal domain-containing protein [Chloroherpetonaceae bacterium]|nr:glycosyltransferase N-terminal domain-containing protein [Chloroherpetonaceae bacterium]